MREYGQIQSAFWQSSDIGQCSDQGKLLAAYLLTGPHSNGLGCFRLTDGYVMDDFGWSSETVSKAFEELSRNGFANRFGPVVFIPKFLQWNAIANPNVASARSREFEALPKSDAKPLLARAMLEFCRHWSPAFRTVLETVSEGLPKQNPTLPNPTQPKKKSGADKPRSGSSRAKSTKITFDGYLAECKAAGEKAIPEDHPVFRFADETGIPVEFVRLAWREFRRGFGPGGKDAGKLQAGRRGWRAHFDNAVRRNWFRLWHFANGDCELTTAGEALRREADAEAQRESASSAPQQAAA